jgi:hypothetical protein
MFLKNYPYLDPISKHDEIMFTFELNVNESLSNATTCIQHDFKDEIYNYVLNCDQLKMLNILIKQLVRLQILEGTLGSGKTFF